MSEYKCPKCLYKTKNKQYCPVCYTDSGELINTEEIILIKSIDPESKRIAAINGNPSFDGC